MPTGTRPRLVRILTVSGVAAAALLSSAAPAAADALRSRVIQPAPATADGARVALPSGRTLRVPGLNPAAVAYRAEDGHRQTVADLGAGQGPPVGTSLQTPRQPESVRTQSGSAGAVSVSAFVIVVCGIVLYVGYRSSKFKVGHMIIGVVLGVMLAGTFIGDVTRELTTSLATSMDGIVSGL